MEDRKFFLAKVLFYGELGYTDDEERCCLMEEVNGKLQLVGPATGRYYNGHKVLKFIGCGDLVRRVMG